VSTTLISRIGKDIWGDKLISLLKQQGIESQFIQVDQDHSTGIVNAHLKEDNQVEYDIVYPVAWDFISMQDDFVSLLKGAEYFVFGSLAARNEVSRNTLFQLLDAANKKILDINLRPPHFDKATIISLLERADMLKLNDHEIRLISGWFNSHRDMKDQLKSLQDQFHLKTILVTRGENGALVNHKGVFSEHNGYKVKVEDTIGSGDAFLAGYLFQVSDNKTPEEALKFANALGAFIATQPGACPRYDLAKVYELMQRG
jgi:fructokinase